MGVCIIFALKSADLQGFDVIIDAFGEWQNLSLYKKYIELLDKILQGNSAKFVVVGGAGSLYVDKSYTTRLMDTSDFPKEYMGVAEATTELLEFLHKSNLDWLYISPAAIFYESEAQEYEWIDEKFKLNSKGESKVSCGTYSGCTHSVAYRQRDFNTTMQIALNCGI